MQIVIPEDVKNICDSLENSGFEAWVVGGCMRDFLLGEDPKDWDITTNATYEQICDVLRDNAYIIPMEGSKEHNVCFARYNHNQYEIATFREDVESIDHRHAVTKVTNSIENDLKRRDFTINAMAYRPKTDVFLDLFDGKEDLKNGIIKSVGSPEDRINEDALRILRAYRFSAKFGFTLDENLEKVCQDRKSDIAQYCSKERQREEINKLLNSEILNYDSAEKLVNISIPGLDDMVGKNLQLVKDKDSIAVKWATLLYRVSNEKARQVMEGFNFDKETTIATTKLLRDREIEFGTKDDIKRYMAKESLDLYKKLRIFQDRTDLEHNPIKTVVLSSMLKEIIDNKEPYKIADLKINGEDLLERGYSGKEIGEKLDNLLLIVIKEPRYNDRNILLSMCNRDPEPISDMF